MPRAQDLENEAVEMARYYKIPARQAEETAGEFVSRVAGAMRNLGHVIEAHELAAGYRFDDPEHGSLPMTGVVGAVAFAMQDRRPFRSGCAQIGDEHAAGELTLDPRNSGADHALLLLTLALGGR